MKIFYPNVLETQIKCNQIWFKALDHSMTSPSDSFATGLLAYLVFEHCWYHWVMDISDFFSGFGDEIHSGPKQFSSEKFVKNNGSDFNESHVWCKISVKKFPKCWLSFMIQIACCCNNSLCPFSLAVSLKCPYPASEASLLVKNSGICISFCYQLNPAKRDTGNMLLLVSHLFMRTCQLC